MGKAPKMTVCRTCNNPIAANAKVCPHCGAKNKKPFYKREWFIVLAVIVVLGVIGSIGGGGKKDKAEKFSWKDIKLNEVLPEPRSHVGEIVVNSDDQLNMYVSKTSKEDYQEYLKRCQDKGFTVESEDTGILYTAYNEDGYDLSLMYSESEKELMIDLSAPMEMDTLQWPTSELVSLLPVPKSNVGTISSESSDRFFVYVGKTFLDDYHDYVDECAAKGFTVDYDKGEKYYYADNDEGYHISVKYEGNHMMSIEIEKPQEAPEEPPKEPEGADTSETVPGTEENPSASKPDTEPSAPTELVNGMRPEFKEAMDQYEAFYNEYCDFMKKFNANSSDLTLLTKYADMLGKLSAMDEKFDAWEGEDMNDAELQYYLEVQSRITAKLLEING